MGRRRRREKPRVPRLRVGGFEVEAVGGEAEGFDPQEFDAVEFFAGLGVEDLVAFARRGSVALRRDAGTMTVRISRCLTFRCLTGLR